MARKIAVLNSSEHLKKSVALLLVRRLVAVWEIPGVMIRRLTIIEQPRELPICRGNIAPKPYIPTKLPPAEVGGCHFQLPQSDNWKLEHRQTAAGYERIPSNSWDWQTPELSQ